MALSKKSHCHEFTSLLVTNPVLHEQKNLIDQPFATVEHLRAWFPKCDPESKENQTTAVKWRRRSRLLLVAFIVAMVVFVTNFVTLLVLYYDKRFQYSNGFVSVFEGSCSASRQLSIVFHIIINVLSSGLLAASNLCMQLSTAPSRAQVDQAHQDDSDYYDIGILSVRNWWKATRASKMLCILLVLSSLPLHFMYNSVISTTDPQFAFPALVVTRAFLDGGPVGTTYYDVNKRFNTTIVEAMQAHAKDSARYQRIEKSECVATYSDPFQPRSNLLIVTEDGPQSVNSSLLEYMYFEAGSGNWSIWDQQVWICSEGYDKNRIRIVDPENPNCSNKDFSVSRINHWQKWKHPIQYCLMLTQTKEFCSLNFSPVIMIVVCFCNLVKCACIFFCFSKSRKTDQESEYLCTIGDAVASFLAQPYPTIKDPQHLLTYNDRLKTLRTVAPWLKASVKPLSRPARWYETVSQRCLATTFSACSAAVVLATLQLISSVRSVMAQQVRTTVSEVFDIGFGHIDPSALLVIPGLPRNGVGGFIGSTLYANYWQVLVSILYFAANSLLTRYHVSHEWSRYANGKKLLRVSQPKGMQRSTYFISLPYKYGAPLLIASVILHLLVSQSIFLVNGKVFVYTTGDPTAELAVDEQTSFVTAGINCWGILASIIFGSGILIALLATSWLKRLASLVPIVATDSRSIQSHCQAPEMDREAHLFPVRLAVIRRNGVQEPRCAFTSHREVTYPADQLLALDETYR